MPIGKTDSVLGQFVDMGGSNVRRPLKPQVRPTKIIGKKDNDVRFVASVKSDCEVTGKEKEG